MYRAHSNSKQMDSVAARLLPVGFSSSQEIYARLIVLRSNLKNMRDIIGW